jgi:hypothetical protein
MDECSPDPSLALSCGIRRVLWSGCLVPKESANLDCGIDTTGIANDITTYRHVAWDPFNELFYFCDVTPRSSGLVCKANVAGSVQWIELPRSLQHFIDQ